MSSTKSAADQAAARLRLALELFSTGEAMMRQNLIRQYPNADEQEIEIRLLEWLGERPGAEYGDSAGRPVPFPNPHNPQ